MTEKTVAARIAMTAFVSGAFERMREDRGQGSIEYIGIIIVVVAIIGAIVLLAPGIGDVIGGILQEKAQTIGDK